MHDSLATNDRTKCPWNNHSYRSILPILRSFLLLGLALLASTGTYNFLFFSDYSQQRFDNETPVEFASRVQHMIAEDLGIYPTNYSFKDALAIRRKRMKAE
jgi:hypothetical protein